MSDDAAWHRKQALHIASQLPENADDAWAVLDWVERLVRDYFGPRKPDPPPGGGQLVRFPGGPTSPKRRARSTDKPTGLPK